jgi:AcrR family transcriptional regulator
MQRVPAGTSIWTRPARSARGPAPEHSRAEIASAGVALADEAGLPAVTMRSVAAAIWTGPASLYRYVANRAELVELMADQARGELGYQRAAEGEPLARLLAIAREGRALYLRHPWLLDVPAAPIPGPNAVAFIEHCLAALAGTDLPGPARLETVGLFSGAIRLIAQTETEQRRAGQAAVQWQGELAGYLARIVAAGQHPNLAAALADGPSPAGQEDLFEHAMRRILAGLLAHLHAEPASITSVSLAPGPAQVRAAAAAGESGVLAVVGAAASRLTKSLLRISSSAHTAPTSATAAVMYSSSFRPEAKLDRSASAVAPRSAAGTEASTCWTDPCRTAAAIVPAEPASDGGSVDARCDCMAETKIEPRAAMPVAMPI